MRERNYSDGVWCFCSLVCCVYEGISLQIYFFPILDSLLASFTVYDREREKCVVNKVLRNTLKTHTQQKRNERKTTMFEGAPDQFHQFVASRTSTLPLPLSFPSVVFQGSSNTTTTTTNFSSFDPYSATNPTHHVPPHQVLQPNFLHQLHQASSPPNKHDHHHKEESSNSMAMNFEIDRQRSIIRPPDSALPWSNDELLALLRIRSSLENWPPELITWEHVSRKLAQHGFKRSAEKCKEKFEEESRYFNSNINYNKGFRGFSELEELCHHGNHHQHQQQQQQNLLKENNNNSDNNNNIVADCCDQEKNKKRDSEEEDNKVGQNSLEAAHEDSRTDDDDDQNLLLNTSNDRDQRIKQDQIADDQNSKKRKRQKKFEMFKSFCEDFVSKMMAQQEEMHNKLLEDMMRRDEGKVAKEEAWKKQELDRINKEIEIRAQEQASVGDRQATIINYLKKFTSLQPSSSSSAQDNSSSSSLPPSHQNPNSQTTINDQTTEKNHPITPTSLTQNPSSMSNQNFQSTPTSLPTYKVHALKSATSSDHKDDIGKRWPRDEVLELINLRCKLYNGNEDNKEGVSTKAPLWERISQGMMELGYKRSAKRCKEKWENINKYFRKTKDTNKKRSIDSRTCPYFHQLSTLYNQEKLVLPPDGPGNHSASPENGSVLLETRQTSTSSQNGSTNSTMHDSTVGEGEKNMVHQVPSFDFEF